MSHPKKIHALLQAEAALGEFNVTEAFLQLTLSLLQSGLHTASLQVLCQFQLSTTRLSPCSHATLYGSNISGGMAAQKGLF